MQWLAEIRAVEGWSVGNAFGALLLGAVALGLAFYAFVVILRR